MINKQQFIGCVENEVRVILHLAEKVNAENANYKPTDGQRTTLELLAYLAYGPATALAVVKSGDMSLFGTSAENQKSVTLENFAKIITEQKDVIKNTLESMTDEEMNEEIDLWKSGEVQPKSMYILQLVLEAYVAYKMQLFLYLKSSGLTHLNTSNVWRGKDSEPKA